LFFENNVAAVGTAIIPFLVNQASLTAVLKISPSINCINIEVTTRVATSEELDVNESGLRLELILWNIFLTSSLLYARGIFFKYDFDREEEDVSSAKIEYNALKR
jgi:hypothetical protein